MMKPGHDMSFFFKPSRIPVNHEHDSFLVKRKKWKPQIKCYLVNVVYQIITCYTNISNNSLKPRMKPSRIPGNHEQWLHAYIVHSTLFSATCSSSTSINTSMHIIPLLPSFAIPLSIHNAYPGSIRRMSFLVIMMKPGHDMSFFSFFCRRSVRPH